MTNSAVVFAITLMGLMGVTHLVRPQVWRLAISGWAQQGAPGVVLYGTLHALPGALMIALVLPVEGTAEIIVLVLGLILTIKGTVLIVLADRCSAYLLRMTAKSDAAWRAGGLIGVFLVAALLLTAWGLL